MFCVTSSGYHGLVMQSAIVAFPGHTHLLLYMVFALFQRKQIVALLSNDC